MLGSRNLFNQMVSDTVNRFAGQLVKVITSEEPDLYCLGTLQMEPSYDPLTGKGQLIVSCEDGDSYRYYTEETTVTISGDGTAVLNNDYMPVQPTVKTTAETALAWKVGTDEFMKSVSAGIWTFPELELGYGENTISITTSGNVTFYYREGRL
jgi:hypothetical protein